MQENRTDRFPNRLVLSASPYLLQHAYNPVDWYPWSDEALEKAVREDKPILVSIGYSTCHWCHVMERESFEDLETARFMNTHFVNIKVDREERPDIDHLYMDAVQLLSGSGGWPLNCFLTPQGKPFYGGTYFPPAPAYQRPSWKQVLAHIAHLFKEKRDLVESQAERLATAIRDQQVRFLAVPEVQPAAVDSWRVSVDQMYRRLFEERDEEAGGFGGAPKFPRTGSLEYLLTHFHFTGEQEAKEHVGRSLHRMARGGIYDQIGGGFARYATDRHWQVPHFEKMLYDNALLLDLIGQWCRVVTDPEMERVAKESIEFAVRELRHPAGAFYSALDADSEGEEGKFYTWTASEFRDACGQDHALWSEYLSITDEGNWEGTNIPSRAWSDQEFALRHGRSLWDLHGQWRDKRKVLLDHRANRIRPGLDDKVVLSWNAMMISGLLSCHRAFEDGETLALADGTLAFIERYLERTDGSLLRVFAGESAYQAAFLEDYAWYIKALLDRIQVGGANELLAKVESLADLVLTRFYDSNRGAFRTAHGSALFGESFDLFDGATPSGNAIMVDNLYVLHAITGHAAYREKAEKVLMAVASAAERFPGSFAGFARSMACSVFGRREIVVAGEDPEGFVRALLNRFMPGTVILSGPQEDLPALQGRVFAGKTYLYACAGQACQMPVEDLDSLWKQL